MITIKIQPVFTGMPPEIALAMFEEMMLMEELIDNGVRCSRCGELVLPSDMHDEDLCKECVEDLIGMAIKMEREEREQEERVLEAVAEFYKMISLLSDDFPIDLRQF